MNNTARRTRRAVQVLPVALALVLAACGGSDDGAATTTAPESTTTTTTTMATTTTEATTTTAPPTTTATTGTGGDTASDDLPTELGGGSYIVGEGIRTGFWVSDQCGCPWYHVDEMGNKTQGTGEDAEVTDADYEIELGSCNWTWDG